MSIQDQGEGKSAVEKIRENFEIGTPIFDKIFSLDIVNFKIIIREILETFNVMEDDDLENFIKGCDIKKEIVNDAPSLIEMQYFDIIKINQLGIVKQSEHSAEVNVVRFNKYFKIPDILT